MKSTFINSNLLVINVVSTTGIFCIFSSLNNAIRHKMPIAINYFTIAVKMNEKLTTAVYDFYYHLSLFICRTRVRT